MNRPLEDFDRLPGGDLARNGLEDLAAGRMSEYALLLLLAKPRLSALGLSIPEPRQPIRGLISHALYDYLAQHYGADAYSRHHSLMQPYRELRPRPGAAKIGSLISNSKASVLKTLRSMRSQFLQTLGDFVM